MQTIFKTLLSIVVSILFISGCVATIASAISRIVEGQVFGALTASGIGVACLLLSVVAWK